MLKRTRLRAVVVPATGLLLAGVFSLGAVTTASAAATGRRAGCKKEVPGHWGAVASCSSHNGGSNRAYVLCTDAENGQVANFYGPWKQWGTSIAYCQHSYRATSAGIETSVHNNT